MDQDSRSVSQPSSSSQQPAPPPKLPPTRAEKAVKLIKKMMKVAFIATIAVACLGAMYETASGLLDARRYPTPGKLYDVGGYRLHLNCLGQGSPTVVLESGLGRDSLDWSWVQPRLAERTRVCSYDRAGSGWSDPGHLPRDSRSIAKELRALIDRAGLEGPLLLVGHSAGGSHLQLFHHGDPEDVAGLVLVDVSHLEAPQPLPRRMVRIAKTLHFFGALRALGLLDSRDLPADLQPVANALVYRRAFLSTLEAENADAAESLWQVHEVGIEGSLADLPLLLLTAARPMEEEPRLPPGMTLEEAKHERALRQQKQTEMLKMSSRSRQVFAKASGHQIQKNQPDLVVDAVGELIDEIRNSR